MYVILGWVGWIWLAIVAVLLPLGLWMQNLRRRRHGERATSGTVGVEVNGNNEKQS
jgi:hypothetical protein